MTIRKTKILILALALLSFQAVNAQSHSSVTLEGSQTFPSFRFVANGNADNNGFRGKIDRAFTVGYQYYWKQGMFVGADFGLYNAGATKVFGAQNYSWDLHYMRAKIELGYIVEKWWIKPYVIASPYYGYLLKASESVGPSEYDLKKGDELSTSDFGIVATGGARVKLSQIAQVFVAYNQNFGLLNIETNPGQKLYNRGFSLSLGLAINLDEKTITNK